MKKETLMELIGLALENKVEMSSEIPFEVGKKYFIRTVTYHLTGEVEAIKGNFLVLKNGAWIADSGRFNEMIKNESIDIYKIKMPSFDYFLKKLESILS